MPLFISDNDFTLISNDVTAVAERADAFIREIRRQLDTVRAEADASSITAEQTCSLLEQKYSSLYSDFSRIQSENAQLSASIEARHAEIAEAKAEKHQLTIKDVEKDREIERLSVELAEMQKGKRQLMELVELKDGEIREKNATIQSYLDKIINLTENNSSKEARVQEAEAELGRCRASFNCVTQEKELIEKHNAWLNEELNAKITSLVELRRTHMDVEAELSSKLADQERQLVESSNSLKWSKERVQELESRVNTLEEELRMSKDVAAASEEQFAAELSTATKLVELYKASSEEWSKKAVELEGVIKALETHLSQTENDYKGKLEKEISVRRVLEKEVTDLREKLEKCEAEIENSRKTSELGLLPLYSFQADLNQEKTSSEENVGAIINVNSDVVGPRVPRGISGTALAASLLRDGWSLAKMYEKYQETYDAFVHESRGRKELESILNQVHHMIEEKVEMISEERAEHERMVEAYNLLDQKLQQALLEHDNLENTVRQLKAEVKVHQRDFTIAQKEINDLQKQVTILLKECQDVQLRCGASAANSHTETPSVLFEAIDTVSEHLLTFKDIDGLVEQNVHLRRLVHTLSLEEEKRDAVIKEGFQMQLQKVADEATTKVEAVLKRSEEQANMIESLHTSVAMYKRLYDEERKIRSSNGNCSEAALEGGNKEVVVLIEGCQDVTKKLHEQLTERTKNLEQELSTLRSDIISVRSERDKMSLEANFARERLDSFMKEFDRLRQEANAVSARNIELSNLIVSYEKRLRECSDSLQASEENSRKLSMEVSFLKHEKEIIVQSEKRASDEVRSLSERVYRLQSSLDTIQNAEEARENARANERIKHEEYLKRVERDWAEAKKELQEERDRVRCLTLEKEKTIEDSERKVEETRKELVDALRAVASAESRAAVLQARSSDLEGKANADQKKITKADSGHEQSFSSTDEVNEELMKTKEELEKKKEEARVNKQHMLQYKEIARINEIALKQIESAHEEYNLEAEKLKKTFKDEVQSLQNKVHELEGSLKLKSEESASLVESKEHALSLAMTETLRLREDLAGKLSHIELLDVQVSSLKDDVDKEHKRWRTAQDNYERQVILQSSTIQELTNTSKALSELQSDITKLRELSEGLKTENDLLKKTWDKEKTELQQLKYEAERKYDEVNEQNKILHNRLETLHIRLADKEHTSSSFASKSTDIQTDSNLQNVISYLRRSKEIAETEISLLKQEKSRLHSQLGSALKASESAQASLRSQYENSRSQLFKDEEFKSLQLQVKEINLLRESNMQLRAENKHNFEECQKFREEAQKAQMEAEKYEHLLREKEVELNACQKEVEMLKMEIGHLNSRIAELRDTAKNVDVEEYEQMKDELKHIKVLLGESESEVVFLKRFISEKEECIATLEQTLARCQSDLTEQEKRLNDALQAEASAKAENEKRRKIINMMKKRIEAIPKEKETLTREKEELLHKNQDLLKQIEDSKPSRRNIGENSSEQAKLDQEKDTRIQMLEKTLERAKEDLKKEIDCNKLGRVKDPNFVRDLAQNVRVEKEKVEEELVKHKHAIAIVLERSGLTAAQLPSGTNLDEQTLAYYQSIRHFTSSPSEISKTLQIPQMKEILQSLTTELPVVDTSIVSHPGREVTSQQVRLSAPQATEAAVEEREKRPTSSKPVITEPRKLRRIVRPRLERPAEVTKVSEAVPSKAITEERKPGSIKMKLSTTKAEETKPQEAEIAPHDTSLTSSDRKRSAAASLSEPNEDLVSAQNDANDEVVPTLKKSKNSETSSAEGYSDIFHDVHQPSSESHDIPSVHHTSFESHDTMQQLIVPSDISEQQVVPLENIEIAQARIESANDDIVDEGKTDEDVIDVDKEETEEEQLKESSLADPNQEDNDHQDEGDTVMMDEELLTEEKSSTEMDLVDQPPKEDAKEELLMSEEVVCEEEEREEGELMPDDDNDLERQQEGAVSGEEGEIGDDIEKEEEFQADEKIEEVITVIEEIDKVTEEKQVSNNNEDEGAPEFTQSPKRSTNNSSNDQTLGTFVLEQSPQKFAAVREGSPVPSHPQSPVSERQRSPGPNRHIASSAVEMDEQIQTRASGRTISISEKARENARLRQARMPTTTPTPTPTQTPRGRGRGTRGARGPRGRGGRS